MKKPDLGYYISMVNTIVNDTEKIGTTLNHSFEEIRTAIDDHKTAELSQERLAEIVAEFQGGTDKYKLMLEQISTLRPPARILGIHKKFERSYMAYVAGCEEMVLSLQPKVDIEAFNAAEAKQDQATDEIAVSIQKMTQMLMR
ncbi:hypothetical protein [Enterococcus bulliens]